MPFTLRHSPICPQSSTRSRSAVKPTTCVTRAGPATRSFEDAIGSYGRGKLLSPSFQSFSNTSCD
jgi:hypothetical protein